MKGKINWIVVVVFSFIVLVIIGFLTIKKPAFNYKMTSDEILAAYLSEKEAVKPDELLQLKDNQDIILIDVGIPSEYVKGHFESAINIPYSDLLSAEYQDIFKNDKQKLIYGREESVAIQAWMVLKQIGCENIKYVMGGYQACLCIINADSSFDIRKKADENLLYDFSNISKTDNSSAVNSEDDTKSTIKQPVKVKPRKNQPSGGC